MAQAFLRDTNFELGLKTRPPDRNNCIYLLTFRIQRIRSPPRLPPAVACSSRSCSHLVIFGDHFNQVMWDEYAAEDQMYRQQKRNDNVVLVTEVVYVFF